MFGIFSKKPAEAQLKNLKQTESKTVLTLRIRRESFLMSIFSQSIPVPEPFSPTELFQKASQ